MLVSLPMDISPSWPLASSTRVANARLARRCWSGGGGVPPEEADNAAAAAAASIGEPDNAAVVTAGKFKLFTLLIGT